MNDKVKTVLGFFRSAAIGIGVQSAYVCLDQTVRSLTNEFIKKQANNGTKNKKKEPQS